MFKIVAYDPFEEFKQVLSDAGITTRNRVMEVCSLSCLSYENLTLPQDLSLTNNRTIYARGVLDRMMDPTGKTTTLEATIRQKFLRSSNGNWALHWDSLIGHARVANSARDFGDWFINESFLDHIVELFLVRDKQGLNDISIYVNGGVHRMAILEWVGYPGSFNRQYFWRQFS